MIKRKVSLNSGYLDGGKRYFITTLPIVNLVMLLMKELVLINENRFCTYQHRLVVDGSLICVGHGTRERAKSSCGRNKAWKAITKDNQWYCLIVKDCVSKDDAEELELKMIAMYNPLGNTRTCSLKALTLDSEEAKRKFYYDETSPSGLRWNVDLNKNTRVGDAAGYPKKFKDGIRYAVDLHGKSRLAHRVVWCLCKGSDVPEIIDHVDGNPSNNKISNLRASTSAENNRNRKLKHDHTTGYSGVSLTDNGYVVCWREAAVTKRKVFSCKKYGNELALALAIEYRYRILKELQHLGQEYSERHTGVYTRHPALADVTENEIQSMFNCKLTSCNSSGTKRVQRVVKPNGSIFWIYKSKVGNKHEARTFAALKYGEDLAKNLAVEFSNRKQGLPDNSVDGYSLDETNTMLNDNMPSKNTSGITGIRFLSLKTGNYLSVHKTVNYKNLCKRICVSKLGLLEAIALAIRWRKSLAA